MEEVSISIEETNKLRAQIGLPPIPIPQVESVEDTSGSKSNGNGLATKKEELSIEETNKLRVSLGLKPIEVTVSTNNQLDDYEANYRKHQEDLGKKSKEDNLKNKLEAAKLQAQKRRKLKFGKTLLDDYDEDQSTDDWLSNIGKTDPKEERDLTEKSHTKKGKQSKISDEHNPQLQISYNSKELNKVKDNEIFTLEDNDLSDETDNLTNEKLNAAAKVERDLKDKKLAEQVRSQTGYKSLNSEEADETENEDKIFLEGSEIKIRQLDPENVPHVPNNKKRLALNLFDDEDQDALDKPKKESSTKPKMKKLKKKKEDKNRTKINDDGGDGDDIKLDTVNLTAFENEVEDDLEVMLAKQRQLKQKSRNDIKPEDIASEIRHYSRINAEENVENDMMRGNSSEDVIFDPTSDFLSSLKVETEVNEEPEKVMDAGIEQGSDTPESSSVKQESSIDVESETKPDKESEPLPQSSFGGGLALTLKYLKSSNLIQPSNISKEQRESMKQAELMRLKISIEERILKETLSKDPEYKKLSKADQEKTYYQKLDQVLIEKNIVSGDLEPIIKDYKPNVQIVHRDKIGKELDTKEAFKYLSQNFHGTKSNPNKNKSKPLNKFKKAKTNRK